MEPTLGAALGPYLVLKSLSRTRDSHVLLAENTARGGPLSVVKLLRLSGPRAIDDARKEFELLWRFKHPGVAEVEDFGFLSAEEIERAGLEWEAGSPGAAVTARKEAAFAFIASTYYRGLNLREAFLHLVQDVDAQAAGPAPGRWIRFCEAIAKICWALDAVHEQGLIHYDIKPENLLLVPGEPGSGAAGFEVRILDFGLAEAETTPLGTRARGTVPYLAPEVVSKTSPDRRSDLFSLGVSIAMAVSGQFPFPGNGPRAWLEAARAGKRIPLRALRPDAPEALAAVVEDLLEASPSDRPARASHVAERLERELDFRLERSATAARKPFPRVGWERELSSLRDEVERLRRGEIEKSLIVVEGDSGQLLDRFLSEAELTAKLGGARVLTGSAMQPRKYPYQPFAEILGKISTVLDLEAERFRRFWPVLRLLSPMRFPQIEEGAAPPLPPLRPRLEIYRFLDLATELFLEIAKDGPLVLCVRDLHLGGIECLDLTRSLARNSHLLGRGRDDALQAAPAREQEASSASGGRLLIVASVRRSADSEGDSEGVLSADALDETAAEPYSTRLVLENVPLARVAEWLHERSPDLRFEGDLVRRLHDKSSGSPWLLEEFVQRTLKGFEGPSGTARSRGDDAQGSVDGQVLFGLPRQAEESACERIAGLDAEARRILEVLATAHGALSQEQLGALCGSPGIGLRPLLGERLLWLESLGFVTLCEAPSGGCLLPHAHLSHPALSDLLYRQIPEAERAETHRDLARALLAGMSADGPGRVPEDIAFHARLGNLGGLHVRNALLTAEKLSCAACQEAAARHYEEILEGLGKETPGPGDADMPLDPAAIRKQVNERLAAIYLGRGQLHKALERLTLLSATQDEAPGTIDNAVNYRLMGEVYHQNGEVGNAAYFFEQSLKLLKAKGAGDDAAPLAPADVRAAQERCLSVLAMARHHVARETLDTAEAILRENFGNEAGSASNREAYARAHMLLGQIAVSRGRHPQGFAESREALRLAEEDGSVPLLVEILGGVGSGHLARSDFDEAAAHFRRGLELSRRLESKFDVAHFESRLGTLFHNKADPARALECFMRSLSLSSQIGDLKGIANGFNNLGLVHRLRDDLVRATDCYKRAIDIFTRINDASGMATGMNNLSAILELEGRYDEALDYSFLALKKRKYSRSLSGTAFSHYRIGRIYQAKGEIGKALNYAKKSLETREEIGDELGKAHSHVQLSELFLAIGGFGEALEACQAGMAAFQRLENEVGQLVARQIHGRVLFEAGMADEARQELEAVLESARTLEQRMLKGTCQLHLGRIAAERGGPDDSEDRLAEAERLFRAHQNKRELAETLLAKCDACLTGGQELTALDPLEEAYSLLEEIGARDLVPVYFLLRGRLELESTAADGSAARKYLERGLAEAREIGLKEIEWRFLHLLATLEGRNGDAKMARIHLERAREILEDAYAGLPDSLKASFFAARGRREAREASVSQLLDPKPGRERRVTDPQRAETREDEKAAMDAGAEREEGAGQDLILHSKAIKLHEIASALGTQTDLRKLLEEIMDAVLELVDAERGFLILKGKRSEGDSDATDAEKAITVARNLDGEEILKPEGKVSRSISKRVMQSGKAVLARNAITESRFFTSKSVRDLRLRSLVCVPLRFREDVLGVIYLDNRHRRDAFGVEDLKVLQAFADQAAVAVKNARLIEENRRRNEDLVTVNRKMESLNVKLKRAVHKRSVQLALAREDLRDRQSQLEEKYRFANIVGQSDAMREIFFILERISGTQLPVLLEGESGTGKELIARAIHFNSPSREGRFVSQNCGALNEALLESELFGHAKGSFTGAIEDKKGLFELANKGTLFLDEIGDMTPSMQQKLLRVLQEKEVRPVGGKAPFLVDARIVSASNRDLLELVQQGQFREDLYFRLTGLRLRVPSLRERKEDIPLLVEHFAEMMRKHGDPQRSFEPEAIQALMGHDWPGNVRELRHLIERTLLISTGETVRKEDLLFDLPSRTGYPPAGSPRAESEAVTAENPGDAGSGRGILPPRGPSWGSFGSLDEARDFSERFFLLQCLRESGGNVAAAARRSRVSRESFYRLLRKHNIQPREN